MDFFILNGKIATLLVGASMNLIINFDEPMDLSGAKANFIEVKDVNKSKSFIINPRQKNFSSNLMFYNGKTKYMFYIKYSDTFSHDFVNVFDGKKDTSFTTVIDKPTYRVLSGQKSVLIENKTNNPVVPMTVNGESFNTSKIFSKGIPLFIEQGSLKESFLKGDSL